MVSRKLTSKNPFSDNNNNNENNTSSSSPSSTEDGHPFNSSVPVNPFQNDTSRDGSSSDRLSVYSQTSSTLHQAPGGQSNESNTNTSGTGPGLQPYSALSTNSPGIPNSRSFAPSVTSMGIEYDRYPHRVSSVSHSLAPLLDRSESSTRMSDTDSEESGSNYSHNNPGFGMKDEFSPFGGYPASSFPLTLDDKEADDYLHNPDPIADAKTDSAWSNMSWRGSMSFLFLICLLIGGACLFVLLPALTYTGNLIGDHHKTWHEQLTNETFSQLSAIRTALVDPDTPSSATYKTGYRGNNLTLVFSDEFNKEGRTFFDGDDQFWQGVDLNYAATNDVEWYDPDALSTANGTLNIRLDAYKNHDLFYRSGMIQSWNRLCFTGGLIEVSISFPGPSDKLGLWPGVWTMGNLARAGYKATSEGVWPYAYNNCDAGITPNQSSWDGLSYLPGQRLSSCTCKGEDHPNPGTGRGAPEIDAIEGTVNNINETYKLGQISQSLQLAPYDVWYLPNYDFILLHDYNITYMNTYVGGPFQQAISSLTTMNRDWYDGNGYQTVGFEYEPGTAAGFITWYMGGEWTKVLYGQSIGRNGNVGDRQISYEPMSIIMNLGLSTSWTYIDWPGLTFPTIMRIDYIRIYQDPDSISVTCDPTDYPTYDYIESHKNAYSNVNLTSWEEAGYTFPKNKLTGGCST